MGVGRWVAWQVCALCTCTGEAGSEASHPGSVPDHGHPTGFKSGLMSRGAARLRAGASFSQFGAKKDGGKTQQEHRWQLASRCPLLPSWINAARARIHTRHVDQRHARWLAAVTCVVAWSYSRPFGQELCERYAPAACRLLQVPSRDLGFCWLEVFIAAQWRCRGGRFPVEDAAITSPDSRTKTKRRRYRR